MPSLFPQRVVNAYRALVKRPGRQPRIRVGEIGSGMEVLGGIPDVDYLDTLGFPEYIEEFKRLANDPEIAKELRSSTLPIISADWKIEPASDNARDIVIAEFVSANILNKGGPGFGRRYWQRVTWQARLRDALRFLQNGFAMFAKSKRFTGPSARFVVYDHLQYLLPESIEEWKFDGNDKLVKVLRSYINAEGKSVRREPLYAEDLSIYTWDQEGANILGKPLIRPMWKPFKFKTLLEKLQMIHKQRSAVGVVFGQLQENPDAGDEQNLENLLKSIRMGNLEKIYALIKAGQEFGWKESSGSSMGLPELIEQQAQAIHSAGGSKMTELGDTPSGSRGVAGGIGAFESMMHTAIALTVQEQMQPDIIELVDDNFTRVVAYPVLRVSRIDPFEQTRSLPEFTDMIAKGAVKADLDTENEIRRRYGFGERAEDAAPPPGPPGGNGGPGGEAFDRDAATQGPALRSDVRHLMAKMGLIQERHVYLQGVDPDLDSAKVDPERIRGQLEQFESQYLRAMKAALRDLRQAVVTQIQNGLVPKAAGQVKLPGLGDLKAQLLGLLRAVRDFGREEATAEVQRQGMRLGRRHFELQPDLNSMRGAVSFANGQAQVLVNLDIDNLAQRIQAQTVAEYNRLVAQGLSAGDIAKGVDAFLASISDRQVQDMARNSTSSAFNYGRNVAVQELKGQLEAFAIRTEVLDDNTCGPCRSLHGKKFRIGSDEYLKNLPPAQCEGKKRCRGFMVVFPK